MRRNREPGTRKPLSCPLSKQRMMVCWLTLQILAASPVVKTVFMCFVHPLPDLSLRPLSSKERRQDEEFGRTSVARASSLPETLGTGILHDMPLVHPSNPAAFPVSSGTASGHVGRKVRLLFAGDANGADAKGKERLPNLSNDRDYSHLVRRVNANRSPPVVVSC